MLAVFGHAGFTEQVGGLLVVGTFTIVMTIIIIVITRIVTPLRVDEEAEAIGLDLTSHGERAYDMSS